MMLTPMELKLLEENVRGELVLVNKFSACANQTTDPEFRNVCNEIAQIHRRHIDVLTRQLSALGATH